MNTSSISVSVVTQKLCSFHMNLIEISPGCMIGGRGQ